MPRHGNRSIVVGVSLLKVIASLSRPATLTEIAAASAMSPTRAHRYLMGLLLTDLVSHDANTGRYELGTQLVDLGIAAISRVDGVKIASEMLIGLTLRTGLASLICVWGSFGTTVIRTEVAHLDSAVRIREGRTLGMLRSSSGLLFLAYLAPEETLARQTQELREWDEQAIGQPATTLDEIEDMRQKVRAAGMAITTGTQVREFAAISAPVFDHRGRLIIALTLVGSAGYFDTSFDGPIAAAVRDAAADLMRRLGGTGPREILPPQ